MRESIGNLISGENVIYRTYIHGAVFLPGIFWLMVGFAFAPSPFPLRFIMIFPLLAAFGLLLRGGLEYFVTEIVLTNHYFVF